MKKLILFLIMICCLISFVSATDYQLIYTNTSESPSGTAYIQPTSNKYNANNFTMNATYNIAIIEFVSANSNAGACTINFSLYTENGGAPGTPISGAHQVFTPTSGLDYNYNFTFVSAVSLSSGKYWMVAWIMSDNEGCWVGSPRGADTVSRVSPNGTGWVVGSERLSFRIWAEAAGPPPPTTSVPQFIYPTPNETEHINYLPTLNCSHNGTGVNFYLYRDNILTYNNITGNYTTGIEYKETVLTEAEHNYTCYVQNTTNGIFSNNITRKFTFDITEPLITLAANNSFTSLNITHNKYSNNLILNINLLDNILLNSLLVNITKSGTVYFNYTNTSLTGTTYNFYENINITSWPQGNYTVQVISSDAHTLNLIKDYDIYKTIDTINFKTDEKNDITIYAENTKEIDAIKSTDRYSIVTKFIDKQPNKKIHLTSKKPIRYINNNKYAGWFVIWNDEINQGNWVDFEYEMFGFEDLTVEKINDYHYIININSNTDSLTFNSIGGLNINHKDYNFEVKNSINNIIYSNFTTYNSQNITRTLPYSINYTCQNISDYILRKVNTTLIYNYTNLTCDGNNNILNDSYQHSIENNYSILFETYINNDFSETSNSKIFLSDLNNPIINTADFDFYNGFFSPNTSVRLNCSDYVMPSILYNSSFNNITLYNANTTINTLIQNNSQLINGINTLVATCSDLFGSTVQSMFGNQITKQLILINEKTGASFDVYNITGVKVYFDQNETMINLQVANSSNVNFTSTSNPNLRVELDYGASGIINKYMDVSLTDYETPPFDNDIRICANDEGITHYQKILYSAAPKIVYLKNNFANCYVVIEYTKFSSSNYYSIFAWTIDAPYTLYTVLSDGTIVTSNIDGGFEDSISLDNIEFNYEKVDVGMVKDTISIQKFNDSIMLILYKNIREDNQDLTMEIYRTDTNALLYDNEDFSNNNNATVYFDYSSYSLNESVLMKLLVTTEDSDGNTETLIRYFTTQAKVAFFNPAIAFTIALLITIFGLTFTAVRVTFSWFGIFMLLMAIFILSSSIMTWYILFLLAMDAVLILYIGYLMFIQNPIQIS